MAGRDTRDNEEVKRKEEEAAVKARVEKRVKRKRCVNQPTKARHYGERPHQLCSISYQSHGIHLSLSGKRNECEKEVTQTSLYGL